MGDFLLIERYKSWTTAISSIEELHRFEHEVIRVFRESRTLTYFYQILRDSSCYKILGTSFYCLTTDGYKQIDKKKVGITTRDQKELRDDYSHEMGDVEINIFCSGHLS